MSIDDEWYTQEKDIKYFLENFKIDKKKTIWCPFDTQQSNFVIVLKSLGYKVIYSHIDNGQDFYKYEPIENYDLIISNPPFRNKANIIKRLQELNKPFALIFGVQCFNSGGFVSELQKLKNLELVFLTKRIKFLKNYKQDLKNIPQPTFHSLWICSGITNKPLSILEGAK